MSRWMAQEGSPKHSSDSICTEVGSRILAVRYSSLGSLGFIGGLGCRVSGLKYFFWDLHIGFILGLFLYTRLIYWGYIRLVLGLYQGYIGVLFVLYSGYIRVVLGCYWGYILALGYSRFPLRNLVCK